MQTMGPTKPLLPLRPAVVLGVLVLALSATACTSEPDGPTAGEQKFLDTVTGSPAVPDLTGAEKSSLVGHGRAACARMAKGDTSIEVLTALNEEMEGTPLQSALLTVYTATAELCPEQQLAF